MQILSIVRVTERTDFDQTMQNLTAKSGRHFEPHLQFYIDESPPEMLLHPGPNAQWT